jgi:hypothetical protein
MFPRRWAGALAVVGAVVAVSARPQNAPQTPTFKSQLDLVMIDVVALDKDGHPVTGLTADRGLRGSDACLADAHLGEPDAPATGGP